MSDEPLPKLPENYTDVVAVGVGGMGAVYKAFDRSLNRTVAIKVIRSGALDAAQVKRFRSEVKALSQLDHPNIIKVHSVGALDDMQPYMVLDFAEGGSLDNLLAQEAKLLPERAIPLFIQIAEALKHAHSKGILHRDVKPGNVILSTNVDGSDWCRLVDFGIARNTLSMTHDLTAPGAVIGSPTYASPEQCTGASMDARSDIYSLGCLMYEVLNGAPPFTGDNAIELLMQHCSAQPAPLSGVAAGLNRVIAKCLMKAPDDRFQNADALIHALRRGDTTLALPAAAPSPGKNSKLKLALAAFCITLIAISLGVIVFEHSQPKKKPQAPTFSPDAIEADRLTAQAQWEMNLGRNQAAEAHYVEALKLARKSSSPSLPDILYQLGHLQIFLEKYAEAEKNLRETLPMIESGDFEHRRPDRYRDAYYLTGRTIELQGRDAEALPYFQKARGFFNADDLEAGQIDYTFARTAFGKGHYGEAEKCFIQALAIYQNVQRPEGDLADVNAWIGTCRNKQGRHTDAIASYTRAAQLYRVANDLGRAKEMQEAIARER